VPRERGGKFYHVRRKSISRDRRRRPSKSTGDDAPRRSQICARSHNRRLYGANSARGSETRSAGGPASVLSDNSKYYDVQNAPDVPRYVICLRCVLPYNRRSLLARHDENEHLPGTYTCRSFVCLNNGCIHTDPFYVLSFREARRVTTVRSTTLILPPRERRNR